MSNFREFVGRWSSYPITQAILSSRNRWSNAWTEISLHFPKRWIETSFPNSLSATTCDSQVGVGFFLQHPRIVAQLQADGFVVGGWVAEAPPFDPLGGQLVVVAAEWSGSNSDAQVRRADR